jgi:hypothetical protein
MYFPYVDLLVGLPYSGSVYPPPRRIESQFLIIEYDKFQSDYNISNNYYYSAMYDIILY